MPKFEGFLFSLLKRNGETRIWDKYEILNAMDFGIPQKRECIFVVSIFGNNPFNFAKLEKMQVRDISEFLEKNASNLYEVR
jgi:type II restriction-modification system methylation subunit